MLEPADRALLNKLEVQANDSNGKVLLWGLSMTSTVNLLYLFYTVDGSLPLKSKHSYLKWKKERLQRAVNLSKKDLQLSNICTVDPHFKHCWSCVLLNICHIQYNNYSSSLLNSMFLTNYMFWTLSAWLWRWMASGMAVHYNIIMPVCTGIL